MTAIPAPPVNVADLVGRLHGTLANLHECDNLELRGVVDGVLLPSDREKCYIGVYLRAFANAASLVEFRKSAHFQAIEMIARGMFELAVDIRLIGLFADAEQRIFGFRDVERLRVATKIVDFANKGKQTDGKNIQVYRDFIDTNSARIATTKAALWPNATRVKHWSGLDLGSRVQKLGDPFDRTYEFDYPQLSWSTHAGLTGVVNLEAPVFMMLCGRAFGIAIDAYTVILETLIPQLHISKAIEDIYKKIDLATKLAFAENRDTQIALRTELLGG